MLRQLAPKYPLAHPLYLRHVGLRLLAAMPPVIRFVESQRPHYREQFRPFDFAPA